VIARPNGSIIGSSAAGPAERFAGWLGGLVSVKTSPTDLPAHTGAFHSNVVALALASIAGLAAAEKAVNCAPESMRME